VGVTMELSAHDRAATIKALADPKSTLDDLVQLAMSSTSQDGGVFGAPARKRP